MLVKTGCVRIFKVSPDSLKVSHSERLDVGNFSVGGSNIGCIAIGFIITSHNGCNSIYETHGC